MRFQAGGTLRKDSAYVGRQADVDLLSYLDSGEYAYVLAPRQMGKSSLKARVEQQLLTKGVRCGSIDLSAIGRTDVTPEQWYFGLISKLSRTLPGSPNPETFWHRYGNNTAPVSRWLDFLETLAQQPGRIVIFIDEVDAALALPEWRDDFFATMRALFNETRDKRQLLFCLIGVAWPLDLVADPLINPFNVGKRVRLEDFTRAECQMFGAGLGVADDRNSLLDNIFRWTHGHPYLTHRLCLDLQELPVSYGRESETVDQLVHSSLLRGGLDEVPLLADAQRRLLSADRVGELLSLYSRILSGDKVKSEPGNKLHGTLVLTGMVAARRFEDSEEVLQPRNLIFSSVFGRDWVAAHTRSRYLAERVRNWFIAERNSDYLLRGVELHNAVLWAEGNIDVTAEERDFILAGQERERSEKDRSVRQRTILAILGLMLAAIFATISYQAIKSRDAAYTANEKASKEEQIAKQSAQDAQYQRTLAERQTQIAQAAAVKAEQLTHIAERQRKLAIAQRQQALLSATEAERQRQQALREKKLADFRSLVAERDRQFARDALERERAARVRAEQELQAIKQNSAQPK